MSRTYRKPKTKAKAICHGCRNNGTCKWCENNRTNKSRKHRIQANERIREMNEEEIRVPGDGDIPSGIAAGVSPD